MHSIVCEKQVAKDIKILKVQGMIKKQKMIEIIEINPIQNPPLYETFVDYSIWNKVKISRYN